MHTHPTLARLIFAFFLIAGAAHAQDAVEEDVDKATTPALSVEEILRRAPQQGDYAESERCIRTAAYRRIEVLNNEYLAFYSRGDGPAWINKLIRRCEGLHRGQTLSFVVPSDRVCAGGAFEGMQISIDGRVEPLTAHCFLGRFVPSTKAQARALKTLLRRR